MHVSDGADARVGRYEPLEVVSRLLEAGSGSLEVVSRLLEVVSGSLEVVSRLLEISPAWLSLVAGAACGRAGGMGMDGGDESFVKDCIIVAVIADLSYFCLLPIMPAAPLAAIGLMGPRP